MKKDTDHRSPELKEQDSAESFGVPEAHPSYGMIGIAHFSGGDGQFFGSGVRQMGGIAISICEGHMRRSLSEDSYFADKELIRIEMTPAQFAEMITSPNIGDGVPCTLARVHGKSIERCKLVNKRERIHKDFEKQMKRIGLALAALEAKAKEFETKASINKTDRQEFTKLVWEVRRVVDDNIPFIQERFADTMEHTLADAKANLEAFVGNMARSIGNEALAKQLASGSQQMLEDEGHEPKRETGQA